MTINLTKTEISQIDSIVSNELFDQFKSIVIFLGHAHSGHSILGAILDSHPNIGIVNELNLPLLFKKHKLNPITTYKILFHLSNSRQQDKGWINTEYKYLIPHGCQGQVSKPIILGDKKGGGSTRVIRNNPEIYDMLLNTFGEKIKCIHVLRDPFENIAAYAHYWGQELSINHVNRYFENLQTVYECQNKTNKHNWLTIKQDKLTSQPYNIIKQVFSFLNMNVTEKQLRNMSSIIKSNVKPKSSNYVWENEMRTYKKRTFEKITNNVTGL